MINMEKKLVKSSKNKKICGVCGGIAEYANCDATLIRLAWVLGSLLLGFGLLGLIAYFVAACIIPEENVN